jgi:hypothetical protein
MCVAAASALPSIIAAVSGLLGAIIGGGATIFANHLAAGAASIRSARESADRAKHERAEKILAKGEELVGLLSGASDWHTSAIDAALTPGFAGMITWPTQPERVEALVLAYFPDLEAAFLSPLKTAWIKMSQTVLEMNKTKLTPVEFQEVHETLLRTASALQRATLRSMRSDQ